MDCLGEERPVAREQLVHEGAGRSSTSGLRPFWRPGDAGAEIRNSAGLLGSGLDVRGEGGYVVVPPSRTHDPYEWLGSSPLARASWLIERLTEGEEATLF